MDYLHKLNVQLVVTILGFTALAGCQKTDLPAQKKTKGPAQKKVIMPAEKNENVPAEKKTVDNSGGQSALEVAKTLAGDNLCFYKGGSALLGNDAYIDRGSHYTLNLLRENSRFETVKFEDTGAPIIVKISVDENGFPQATEHNSVELGPSSKGLWCVLTGEKYYWLDFDRDTYGYYFAEMESYLDVTDGIQN